MEDPLKILIVDDEPEARELLKFMLQEGDQVEVVGAAGNVDDAMVLLKKENPHLVLLDIQMPGKDGFNFIERVHETGHEPGIIFVTAYEHYAIQAIRNSVFDYIMKPVRQGELDGAINRYRSTRKRVRKQDLSQLIEALKETSTSKVKLNTRAGYVLINPQEVIFCQADGNYTHIQLISGVQETTTQNLGAIEGLLKGSSFFRASRSYLLNLRYLTKVDRKSCSCILEYSGDSYSIKIPAQKIKLLESNFT
jgi:two-component system LytT family response regulator